MPRDEYRSVRMDDLGHYHYIQPILQPYLEWLQAKRIRVNGEIIPTNAAPTSSPSTVDGHRGHGLHVRRERLQLL